MLPVNRVLTAAILLLAGCQHVSPGGEAGIVGAKARIADVRYQQAMIAITQAAQRGVAENISRDPRVEDADVVIDCRCYTPQYSWCDMVVYIEWRNQIDPRGFDVRKMVLEACRAAEINGAEVRRMRTAEHETAMWLRVPILPPTNDTPRSSEMRTRIGRDAPTTRPAT